MNQQSYWERESRWYYCAIKKDLFNNWTVYRMWGDKISRRGGKKEHLCQNLDEAEKLYQYLVKRRKWHKYQQIFNEVSQE